MNFSSKGTHPFSPSSSSSSSSSFQKILVPFSFHQSQLQPQQRSWLSSSSTTNNGTELLLMDNPPSPNHCDGDPDSENHHQLDLGVGVRSTANLIEKEHMFDKVVTPSDVGKLNRLVIPKQHAEKYFPLDSSTNEKGLLLNFEDRNGKPWRFRYSYWNSSQSYVMTKGWSRFVKEKKLDAGDVVSFQRGAGEFGKDRLFIDWRRRPDAPVDHFTHLPLSSHHFHLPSTSVHYPAALSHPTFLQPPPPPPDHSHFHSRLQPQHSYMSAYNSPNYYHITTNSFSDMSTTAVVNGNPCPSGPVIYLRSGAAAQAPSLLQIQRGAGNSFGGSGRLAVEPMVFDSVPVIQGKAAAKRLRLFGVNMDCPISESDEICDMLSSSSLPTTVATASTYSHAPQFSSSSTSSIPNAPQFRTFNNYELQSAAAEEESSDKGKTPMSLDLDI